jgi:hypothetical protein
MRRKVYCITCGIERNPKAKPGQCQECRTTSEREATTKKDNLYLQSNGFILIEEQPILCKHSKANYHVQNIECGHSFISRIQNIRKQLELRGKAPCPICGGKERMAKALEAYIEKHGRDYDINDFEQYSKLVRKLSEHTYRTHKHIINPFNLPRGPNTYHLDHVFPIIECYRRNIPVEMASSLDNLQMLTWEDNLRKSSSL